MRRRLPRMKEFRLIARPGSGSLGWSVPRFASCYLLSADGSTPTFFAESRGNIPTPRRTDQPAPVDHGALRQLTAEMGDSSPAGQRELINTYLKQATAWISELSHAAENGDSTTVRTISHTLASSSALVGAHGLAGLLRQAEQVTNAQNSARPVDTTAITREFQRVCSDLEMYARFTSAPNEAIAAQPLPASLDPHTP